jgi:hypothetical protein
MLAAACFFASVFAAGAGSGAVALAATGVPTVITGTNTFDDHGGTLVRGYVTPNESSVSECRFEYGPSEAYGQTAACEGTIGSEGTPVEVTMDAQGLKAGATYHFRIVATNGSGTSQSEDSVFVAPAKEAEKSCANPGRPGVGFLPECRGWEMVSSNAKEGGDVSPDSERVRVANDGSAATFFSLLGFGDVIGDGVGFEYMGVRSEDPEPGNQGWTSHALTPPQPSANVEELAKSNAETHLYDVEGLSEDFNRAVTVATRPITEDPMVKNLLGNLYVRKDLRTPGYGHYSLLTECPVCTSPLAEDPRPVTRFDGATPDYSRVVFQSRNNLTEDASGVGRKVYEWHEGTLTLVSKAPDGSTLPEATAGAGLTPSPHMISSDGSKIFFESSNNLYMRENGTTTVKLNASERTPPAAPARAAFGAISKDGSSVFFTSREPLTNDASPEGNKLYMYDTTLPAEDPNLTLLTPNTTSGNGVAGVLGASDDGSYVYFEGGSKFVDGLPNVEERIVYVWHEGSVSFVGAIGTNDTVTQPYVGPNGSLVYESSANLGKPVGFGFKQQCVNGCITVFSYQPATHQLECGSCNPSTNSAEDRAEYRVHLLASGGGFTGHLSRPVTSDGRLVFFSTPAALVLHDTNGLYDAYVYDMETGRVSLLSSGESGSDSYFLEVTPSGDDVFFATGERLVGWDTDNNYDLYDARVGGGFPEPPLPSPGCEGDACQPAPVSFDDPTPGSSTFAGLGNLRQASVKTQKHKAHKKAKKRKHHRRAAAKRSRRGR